MSKLYNYDEFLKYINETLFHIRKFETFPENVKKFVESKIQQFNSVEHVFHNSVLNSTILNIENFSKKAKRKYKFLNDTNVGIYMFEYLKPYYNTAIISGFKTAELICLLCVYNKVENKVIGYLESRVLVNHFQTFGKEGFIGFINTEKEFQRLDIGTFMIQVSTLYLSIRTRKVLYSDTCMSDDFINCCRKLEQKTNWTVREDYYNNNYNKQQERYRFNPIKLNIKVIDSNQEFEF